MKQVNLFKADKKEDTKYTSKIEVPIYEPKNAKPHILELYDKSKTNKFE